jgi:hypothetical protein
VEDRKPWTAEACCRFDAAACCGRKKLEGNWKGGFREVVSPAPASRLAHESGSRLHAVQGLRREEACGELEGRISGSRESSPGQQAGSRKRQQAARSPRASPGRSWWGIGRRFSGGRESSPGQQAGSRKRQQAARSPRASPGRSWWGIGREDFGKSRVQPRPAGWLTKAAAGCTQSKGCAGKKLVGNWKGGFWGGRASSPGQQAGR